MTDRRAIHEALQELLSVPESAARVIALLERYVKRNPDDCKAMLWYADSLRIVGRCREAVELLKATFDQMKPGDRAGIAGRLGMALEPIDREQAEEWFRIGTDADPDAPGWLWVFRGANLATLERFDAAIECYHEALQAKGVDADEVHLNIGLVYRAKGDYASALDSLRLAQSIAPSAKIDEKIADLEDLARVRRLAESLDPVH